MRIWHFVLIGALAYGLWTVNQKWLQSPAPATAAATGGSDSGVPANCTGKKFCITVFIAPWCGVCLASEPMFQALHKYLPANRTDVGFGLVIGAASPAQNAQKQKDLAPIESHVDDTGSVMGRKQIQAFPTWVITNESGQETFRQAGGFRYNDESQLPQILALLLEH